MSNDYTKWARTVGKQIEDSVKHNYGAGWRHFGPELRDNIIDGKIMRVMINVERFELGNIATGEFGARVQAVRDYLTPRINPEY